MWKLVSYPHDVVKQIYIPSNLSRDEWMAYAKSAFADEHGEQTTTTPWCCMPRATFSSFIGRKINLYSTSDKFKSKQLTDMIGLNGKDQRVWVLNDENQMDGRGQLIPLPEQTYILDKSVQKGKDYCAVERVIHLDNSDESIIVDALQLMQIALLDNYYSGLLTVAARFMMLHAKFIYKRFSHSPVFWIWGKPGTGKTTSVKAAMALTGLSSRSILKNASHEVLYTMATKTTLGIFMDDLRRSTSLTELIVSFHQMMGKKTFSRGSEQINSGLMVASNFLPPKSEERENKRLLIIPFGDNKVTPVDGPTTMAFMELASESMEPAKFGKAIGWAIKVGLRFDSYGYASAVANDGLRKQLSGLLPDTFLGYSILLWFTNELCKLTEIPYEEVEAYFLDKLLPKLEEVQGVNLESPVRQNPVPEYKTFLEMVRMEKKTMITRKTAEEGSFQGMSCLFVSRKSLDPTWNIGSIKEHLKASKKGLSTTQPRRLMVDGKLTSTRCLVIFSHAIDADVLPPAEAALPTVPTQPETDTSDVQLSEEEKQEVEGRPLLPLFADLTVPSEEETDYLANIANIEKHLKETKKKRVELLRKKGKTMQDSPSLTTEPSSSVSKQSSTVQSMPAKVTTTTPRDSPSLTTEPSSPVFKQSSTVQSMPAKVTTTETAPIGKKKRKTVYIQEHVSESEAATEAAPTQKKKSKRLQDSASLTEGSTTAPIPKKKKVPTATLR